MVNNRRRVPRQTLNGHKKLDDRNVVQSRSGVPVDISRTAATAGYRSVPHIWFQRPIDLPPFSFQTIRGMLLDPGIRLNFATRAAPLCSAEFGYKQGDQWTEGVECKYPEVAEFLYKQLQHIWRNFLPTILRAQVWGWSGGEVTLKLDDSGLIGINKLESRHAADVRLLKKGHERWGISVNRVQDTGTVHLPFPNAFFHAYNAEDGEDYGISAALGGYSPWADKWFNGGGLDVRRLFMHKDAYGGMDLGYPDGETWIAGINEPVPNADIARQIVEQIVAGGVTTRPSTRDENGNEKWPLMRATVANNPQHILQYPKDLDDEIRRGMEIPDDVISADGGAAWAGKRVTIASFYASLDHWVVQIICDLKEQIFDHLLQLNFGKVPEYEIKHKPLAQQAMEQQANAGPGAGGQQPGQPQQQGGMFANDPMGMQGQGQQPGMPQQPQVMGLLGSGELSVAELLEAGRRVTRLAVKSIGSDFKESDHPRDEGGQFTEKGKGDSSKAEKPIQSDKDAKREAAWQANMATKSPADRKAFEAARSDGVAIPPAWTEVVYHGKNANIIAEGRDAKGRKQRAENPAYRQGISDKNNARIDKELTPRIAELRAQLKQAAISGSEEAKVLYLITLTGFRIGGKGDGKAEKEAFGASTLLGQHVKSVDGHTVHFEFTGKKGVPQSHSVTDPVVAAMVAQREEGKPLFATSAEKVRKVWQQQYGGTKVHDIRHVIATEVAKKELLKFVPPKPSTKKEADKIINQVSTLAAQRLGNNPSEARATYISPSVWSSVV